MIDHKKLRLALRAKLREVSGLPNESTNWAFDNVKFDPKIGERYLRERLVGLDEGPAALTDTNGLDGFYQIDLHEPVGLGSSAVDDLALAIKTKFNPHLSVSFDTTQVYIDAAQQLSGIETKDWYIVTVRVDLRVYDFTQGT